MRTICLATAFMLFVLSVSAQEQSTNMVLATTSIQTEKGGFRLLNTYTQAFPSLDVTCPVSVFSCTLEIQVSSHFTYDGSISPQHPDLINVTVKGATLPPVDPDATVAVDGLNSCNGSAPCTWSTFGFDWMQRNVPTGATVTVNVRMAGTGEAGARTETVRVFTNEGRR